MVIEDDRQMREYINREENKAFLKSLNEQIRGRAEGLIKFEHAIIKERGKIQIVKDYLDSEVASVQQEKQELFKER